MKFVTCFVAFFLAICIIWIIPFNVPTEINYWVALPIALQGNPPPSLLGGYHWEYGFEDGSMATLYLVSYPFRWAFWVLQQGRIVIRWLTHGVEVREV